MLFEPQAVDKNNLVSTVVKDGYQSLEKICEKVPAEQCPKADAAAAGAGH
jgi:hypothetical protein